MGGKRPSQGIPRDSSHGCLRNFMVLSDFPIRGAIYPRMGKIKRKAVLKREASRWTSVGNDKFEDMPAPGRRHFFSKMKIKGRTGGFRPVIQVHFLCVAKEKLQFFCRFQ